MDRHKAEYILPNTFKKVKRACSFRQYGSLKNACNEALHELKKEEHDVGQEEKYWHVFAVAWDSDSPDVIEAALEGVVSLVEARLVKGGYNVEHEPSAIFLVNSNLGNDVCRAMENLCKIGGEGALSTAKRFGIKALTVCIVSEAIPVHGTLLARILRVLLKLGVSAKSPSAAEPFILAMKEIISIVFFRMEAKDGQMLDMKKEKMVVTAVATVDSDEDVTEKRETIALDDNNDSMNDEKPPSDLDSNHCNVEVNTTSVQQSSMNDADDEELLRGELNVDVEHLDTLRCLQELSSIAEMEDSASSTMKMNVLLGIIQNSGRAFKTTPIFLNSIKGELCETLRKHLTSGITPLISYALRIFVSLTKQIKVKLKPEIQAFVSTILLRVLDSSNQVEEHKLLVLEVLCEFCQDPVNLVEIFVNYDCDLEANDLLRGIISSISRVAKQYPGAGRPPIMDQGKLKLQEMAVQGLVLILRSLICAGQLDGLSKGPYLNQLPQYLLYRDESSPYPSSCRSPSESSHSLECERVKSPDMMMGSSEHSSVMCNFELKMKRQEELELGIAKFNMNPAAGVKWLGSHGYLEPHDAKSIASFLHTHAEKLAKTSVGEYLGHGRKYSDGFHPSVLRAYEEELEFRDLSFEDAIRYFLSGFQLPGEAQKIDRIMEAFAERFCICNPDIFLSADTVFILSFSIVMLNTDLHSPAIKDGKRMTKSDFITNNTGISFGGVDLSPEFLGGIYDRIKCNPIVLKDDEALRVKTSSGFISSAFYSSAGNLSNKKVLSKERDDMLKASKDLLSSKRRLSGYISADSLPPPALSQSDGNGGPKAAITLNCSLMWGPCLRLYGAQRLVYFHMYLKWPNSCLFCNCAHMVVV